MNHKIRLGPIAVFLAVVAVVLTTLAILTTATSNADKVMAERFADVTQVKHSLESEGEKYLMKVDEEIEAGSFNPSLLGAKRDDDGNIRYTVVESGYKLTIVITEPERAAAGKAKGGRGGSYDIKEWKITKEWNAADPFKNVWQGN